MLQKRFSHLSQLHSKVYKAWIKAAVRFKEEHANTIKDYNFLLGDLVLVHHTAIEKSLNHKMCPHYLGPLIVIFRNRGGAYILAELDGTLFDRPIAAFPIIPYFACTKIDLPPLKELLNVSNERLQELRNSTVSDPKGELDDAVNDMNNIEHD